MVWCCIGILCPGRLNGASASADLLAGYHFVGANHWSDATNGTILREILELPQSGALGRYLVERLANTPRAVFSADIQEAQVTAGIPLLQPLLEDLVRHDSFLEVRRAAGGELVAFFGIVLPPDQVRFGTRT